jgi:hypothetical protein
VSEKMKGFIKISNDNGKNWNQHEFPSTAIVNTAYSGDRLFFTTDYTVQVINKDRKIMKLLDSKDRILDSSFYENKIAIVTEEKIFLSNDSGNTWVSKPNSLKVIKSAISKSGDIILLEATRIYTYKNDMLEGITLPNESQITAVSMSDNDEIGISYPEERVCLFNILTKEVKSIGTPGGYTRAYYNADTNYQLILYTNEGNLVESHSKGGEYSWKTLLRGVGKRQGMFNKIIYLDGQYYVIYLPEIIWDKYEGK